MSGVVKRQCPVCDSKESKVIHKLNFNNGLEGESSVDFLMCLDCKMVFKDITSISVMPDLRLIEHDNFLGLSKNTELESYFTDKMKNMSSVLKDNIVILDAGCNGGELMEMLGKNETFELWGLEISGEGVNRARNKGLRVVQGSFYSDLDDFNGKFDLIICSNVIEHLQDPKSAILNFKKWLKPNGFLHLSVPNEEIIGEGMKVNGNLSSILSLEHINHFNMYALSSFCKVMRTVKKRLWSVFVKKLVIMIMLYGGLVTKQRI